MRLEGYGWRTAISTVRLGGQEVRVVRAAKAPRHAWLGEAYTGWELLADRSAAADLAAAWWLAARSPRMVVWLPLRQSPTACGEQTAHRRLDLVLMHHSLGLAPSQWPGIRARLGPGRPHKVTLPANAFREFSREEHQSVLHQEDRDHLAWREHADTLFLTGSRLGFERQANDVKRLAEDTAAELARHPDWLCCAEIEAGGFDRWRSRRNGYSILHVHACGEHW